MSLARKFGITEVLFASICSSTAIYLLALQMLRHYWLWILGPITFGSTAQCAFAWLVFFFLILLLRRLPHRFFLLLLKDRKVNASDFEPARRILEHTGLAVVSGAIAVAGALRMAFTEWDPRPVLLALPLVWLVFLRRLLALPDKTTPANSFTQPGSDGIVTANRETGSAALLQAEEDEREAIRSFEER